MNDDPDFDPNWRAYPDPPAKYCIVNFILMCILFLLVLFAVVGVAWTGG